VSRGGGDQTTHVHCFNHQRLEILGCLYLDYDYLALLHWRSLLRLAKASERLNIWVAHWANHVRPQHWAENPPGKEERRRGRRR